MGEVSDNARRQEKLIEKKTTGLKDAEVRLLVELMRNSRRSDRELAKALGVSQPTVSRMIRKLEKEGVIREYTVIPDFSKLGYEMMGVTFIGFREILKREANDELKEKVADIEQNDPHASLIAVNGVGMQKNRMFISLYENYAAYTRAMQLTRQLPHISLDSLDTFLVDLNDRGNYRLLSMSALARHLTHLRKLDSRLELRKKSSGPEGI